MAKFSVILPVRNGGNYVKECVASVLSQTFGDFNFIILDNNSTDGTVQWLQSVGDSRVKLIASNKDLTIEENWGRIRFIEKNEFITLIGHDDILYKNYLEVMNNLVAKYPNASLYQTHFNYIDSKGNVIRKCKPMDIIQSAPEFLASFLSNIIDSMGTGFMMRAADYDECGGIPAYPNLLFADFELWINLTKKSFKATAFDECFSFRLHQSMTTRSADIKFQNAFKMFLEYLVRLKTENPSLQPVIERYALQFILQYCKGLAHRLLRTPKNKRGGLTVDQFVNTCKNYADILSPGQAFDPYSKFNMRLARQIDSNLVTRTLFLAFKKIYSKPVYS
jgi:glycosyltransferase involved in cell wall biosynthesis